ncbi:hypothetical protein GCM10018781_33330 [Kitasatospora indigofera]|uniref:DNA topoisomerase (ATP-hydrolyzing) n=1 Tax=Kitasatospora indigofera TaxID=67307 RepID=A0A919KTB9_9ACTN|nr:DNA gyrase subunit B [Kitasatospora indigofera]GHH71667.1 hypothetical protein GCM10018781_33330 [Kitasatospora indigofera]
MSEEPISYDAGAIEVLEGWEAVRKRPGMYIGSTGERGLHQLVFAVADRAVNDVLAGRACSVGVTLTPDGGVRVSDDGPGVPADEEGADGGPGLEALLTRMEPGAGPAGRHDVTSGIFRLQPLVTNALSRRLTVEVRREGVRRVQEFARGVAVSALTEAGPADGSGTSITFWPDAEIFEEVRCSFHGLADRFRELAFLNRGLDISLADRRRADEPRSVRLRFPGGARDFVAHLDEQAGAAVQGDVLGFEREDPRMAGTLEVSLRWRGSGEERLRSFANSRPTPGGGTHESGFRDGLAAAVNAYAREQRLLTEADPGLDAERIGEGLTAVVSVKLDDPWFEGPTRDRLGNDPVRACVGEAVREQLGGWLAEHPEQAAAVVGRIVRGARRN